MNMNTQSTKSVQDRWTFLLTVTCVVLLTCGGAYAQRGVGDPTGVVRQGLNPPLTTLSGELVSIETHPCENTTGPALAGTHLIVAAGDGTKYNLHVGPADVVASIVEPLTPGTQIEVRAFRTARMPEDQYVAAKLVFASGKVIELRDASLRPFWAGQSRLGLGPNLRAAPNQRWTGPGQGWAGRGQGCGRRCRCRWQATSYRNGLPIRCGLGRYKRRR